jgi:hypothetical protein
MPCTSEKKPMGRVMKLGIKFFAVFAALIMAIIMIAYISQLAGTGEQNLAAWILMWLMAPALIFQMAVAALSGEVYISSFSAVAILGTLVFYFLVCLALAWLWVKLKST